jgi:hypothetical protein
METLKSDNDETRQQKKNAHDIPNTGVTLDKERIWGWVKLTSDILFTSSRD